MSKVKAKQIERLLAAYARVGAFSANGSSSNVTSALTTALNTAGDGATSVPLQQASTTAMGVLTTTPNNRVEVYEAATKEKLKDSSGNEVYGRITFASAVYTLSFFTLVNGTETGYAFSAATSIDFEFAYLFSFDKLPANALIGINARNVSSDPKVVGSGIFTFEKLNCTALNTVSNLSQTPRSSALVKLTVNGQVLYAGEHFSVSGQGISFSAAQLTAIGYDIETMDTVYAEYFV